MPVMMFKVPTESGKSGTKGENPIAKRQIEKWLKTLPFETYRKIVRRAYHRDPEMNAEAVLRIVNDSKFGIQGAGRRLLLDRIRQVQVAQNGAQVRK